MDSQLVVQTILTIANQSLVHFNIGMRRWQQRRLKHAQCLARLFDGAMKFTRLSKDVPNLKHLVPDAGMIFRQHLSEKFSGFLL